MDMSHMLVTNTIS